MARRSFSLLLARRYLNPRRSMLSSFSIISLIGVLLGVMVLVVVMAVYAGMERDVKSRLLGFTPHILLRYQAPPSEADEDREPGAPDSAMSDWRALVAPLKDLPEVESTAPYVADNVILDVEAMQSPVTFRGINTEDPVQVEGIARMLDRDHHPDSSADMGLDDRVVISSTLAGQFHLEVGQEIRLYSTRNFEQVMRAYKATEKPVVRLAYAEEWNTAKDLLKKGWRKQGADDAIPLTTLEEAYNILVRISNETIREPERELLKTAMEAMQASTPQEDGDLRIFDAKNRKTLDDALGELEKSDAEKMDGEILKGLKEIVLPKTAQVIGIYQSSQMNLNTPDIFMPLGLAQTLSKLGDSVQGISVRLKEPYAAAEAALAIRTKLGPGWKSMTWMEQYEGFFNLISQQRMMMYVALSVIMLVAAFSMMAVMFTVTIQKRREIGVMKALGATSGQIVRVFLYQGMILGFFGAILGVATGRLVIHFRGQLQAVLRALDFDPFSASFTGFTVLPAFNDPEEQAKFAIMAFVLCSLAALVPAFFAARSDAAKSLRNL